MGWRTATGAGIAALLLVGCSSSVEPTASTPAAAAPASTGVPTLTPLPALPTPPATGEVMADLRQSSRDAAAGQMQVWLDNDTLEDLEPVRIRYVDARFGPPVAATRLRVVPSRSERGFLIGLPGRPACGRVGEPSRPARLEVGLADGSRRTLDVEDPVDIAGRWATGRCQQRAVAAVADLAWADTVVDGPVDGPVDRPVSAGDTGTLTLLVTPTGVPGHELTVETVTGTPVLSAVGAPYWTVDRTIRGDDPVTRIALPLQPTRCDPHAFLESGGATAFSVRLSLDGDPATLVLRMSPAGAAAAIDYAQRSCGFS